jgi:chromate transporter
MLRLGCTAFGGPAAHIAMLEDEVVRRRRWLTPERFIDLLGAANLIPGPTSTEMVMHTGMARAGRAGLWVAGVCFIGPAALITLAFAWAYARLGSLPAAQGLLFGVKPAVVAIIAVALFRLARSAVRSVAQALLALLVFGMYLLGVNEIALLVGSGVVGVVLRGVLGDPPSPPAPGEGPPSPPAPSPNAGRGGTESGTALIPPLLESGEGGRGVRAGAHDRPNIAPRWLFIAVALLSLLALSLWLSTRSAPAAVPSATNVGLYFLKIGSVLFGSGYVLLAFLEQGVVEQYRWLTHRQLLDAIAVGQFTPGPLFTTATFIGYLVAGVPGAVAATLGIFLPSFVFVGLTHDLVTRLRASPRAAGFLDGVNAGAVALMAAVALTLAQEALRGWIAIGIAVVALVLLLRTRFNTAVIVIGAALAGWLLRL